MRGKARAREPSPQPPPPEDGTDNIVGRYTIFDLEGINTSQPVRRYTIAELAQRLLILAIFETNSGVPSAICIECLKMALGESPCPHGHFPEDPRQAPKLVWPEQGRADARSDKSSPVGSPVHSSQEYWRHSPASDFFVQNQALLATPPGPSRTQAHSHAASSHTHRSGAAAPASPNPERPTGSSTVNWFPCAFSHRHSSSKSALRCNSVAMLNTFEHPPPAAVPVSVERSMQIAMAMSGEPHEDEEDTWSTISRTSQPSTDQPSTPTQPSASTSTARPSGVRTSTSSAGVTRGGLAPKESGGMNIRARTSASSAAVRHVRHQPPEDEDEEPQHPLVPIPPGANSIPANSIHIDDENLAIHAWYVVTTGTTVGVFSNLTVAQRAAQVSRGSWHKVSSRQAALQEFRHAVEENTVIVRA